MTPEEKLDHLRGLPLVFAQQWYIENVTPETEGSSELFFHLRERFRQYQTDPKPELNWEKQWRKLKEDLT